MSQKDLQSTNCIAKYAAKGADFVIKLVYFWSWNSVYESRIVIFK